NDGSAGDQPPSSVATSVAAREASLKQKIAANASDPQPYLDLARLQEDFGAVADAEATLLKGRQAVASNTDVTIELAHFYNRRGRFDKAMEMLRLAAASDPENPEIHLMIATYYYDKVRDTSLAAVQRKTYIAEGIAATDRALAI